VRPCVGTGSAIPRARESTTWTVPHTDNKPIRPDTILGFLGSLSAARRAAAERAAAERAAGKPSWFPMILPLAALSREPNPGCRRDPTNCR
jgi:hypothetical protein